MLGGGSNVLISDAGIRGLVVRMRGGDVRRIEAATHSSRRRRDHQRTGAMDDHSWPGGARGMGRNPGHRRRGNLRQRALPGTEYQRSRRSRDARCGGGERSRDVTAAGMEFGYDFSRLHRTREVVISADFRVTSGDPEALRAVARHSLAYRKRTQPLASPSAGCIFQNPDPSRDRVPDGIPCSAGALVDRAGLKGASKGQARVSPTHANFIINDGQATAADVRDAHRPLQARSARGSSAWTCARRSCSWASIGTLGVRRTDGNTAYRRGPAAVGGGRGRREQEFRAAADCRVPADRSGVRDLERAEDSRRGRAAGAVARSRRRGAGRWFIDTPHPLRHRDERSARSRAGGEAARDPCCCSGRSSRGVARPGWPSREEIFPRVGRSPRTFRH